MKRPAAILLSLFALAACTVTSPDGVKFAKGAKEDEVRARLGEPDLKEEFDAIPGFLNPWGHPPGSTLYFLGRGYSATIYTSGLSYFYMYPPEKRPELEHKARIYREVVPLVPPRATPAEVVAILGPPDLVEREFPRGVYFPQLYGAPAWPPARWVHYRYLDRELAVLFEDDRVKRAVPMTSSWKDQTQRSLDYVRRKTDLAAKDPPRPGMAGTDVRKRWGMPPVVSGIVRGHEVLTLPGDDAGERLRTEITRWYYPSVDSTVQLRGGVVAAIEPLDPARKQLITTFLEQAEKITIRIGRPAEQRLD
jgi:hypothetical protein